MARTVYKYRVWNIDLNAWEVSDFLSSAPSVGIGNPAHAIDPTLTTVVDKISEQTVEIKEEHIPTQGYYRTKGITIDAPTSGLHEVEFSLPFECTLMSANLSLGDENKGDELEVVISPGEILGTLTSDAAIGDSVLNVSSSVVENLAKGFSCCLDDGVNLEDCSYVIDKTASTMTIDHTLTNAFAAATPTYIRLHYAMLEKSQLVHPTEFRIGDDTISGKHMAANQVIKLRYWNNDGVAKKMGIWLKYFF